jgi:hypothetical protein
MTASQLVDRGAVLAGRYRVERLLGRCGTGIAVQAAHLERPPMRAMISTIVCDIVRGSRSYRYGQ